MHSRGRGGASLLERSPCSRSMMGSCSRRTPAGVSAEGTVADMAERWKVIPGEYEGRYMVSNEGRVLSLLTDKILKPTVTKDGYHRFILTAEHSVQRTHLAHSLVLRTFVGPCPPKMEGLHGNGDGLDNRLTNLRYGTRRENIMDGIAHGTHFNASKTHCPQDHPYDEANTYMGKRGRECKT